MTNYTTTNILFYDSCDGKRIHIDVQNITWLKNFLRATLDLKFRVNLCFAWF